MSRMSEIMEMVKQGYSIADIKEVYQIAKETDPGEAAGTDETENKETDTEEKERETVAADTKAEDPKGSDPEADQTDYEQKYNELLKKYQSENVHRDQSGDHEKTIEEKANDVLANLFRG